MPYTILFTSERNDANVVKLSKELESYVESHMKMGWVCTGGVVVLQSEGMVYQMYQAMVKN